MKTFFTIALTVLLGLNLAAQCTPNPAYQDEEFGFWPAPADGIPPAYVGVDYNTPITVKAPASGGEIDPLYAAYTIDSIILVSIDGLPSGIEYACEDPDCFIAGGDLSCMYFYGNTNDVGTYTLTMNFTIYGSSLVFPDQVVPYAYDGYVLEVIPLTGVEELNADQIVLSQNVPNPFDYETRIPLNLKSAQLVNFEIYNMIGERVHSELITARVGANEIVFRNSNLESGIYLYSITADGKTQTKRMAIKK